ncbi:hypothetical protein BDV32DRAFT_120702 [Aspergillus pseudonomiae]|uniref:Uncharacterized protein n=1 Tax=Aspergillus pseudonomiae TaxID=1506151 RepID=A0A5N6I675_9EURO|nr:uncharacterized protein BDV37DRAFT_254468 [Aspergillus pseudonomiae]KAB8262211.1 hypothetical protein BDV32DRAFT_120702 [Aspergillus pseudonomiae]KAE8401645.1 hypothetical protein BDV37DRAFT_254468 [Aspergillus pseudonomiae]
MTSSARTSDALSVLSLCIHVIQCASAIIVLGITAWAVQHTKTTTVIYSLVIAVLTPAVYGITLTISCLTRRRKGNFIPVLTFDLAFSYLWLTAFILLARDFNHVGCRVILWNGETVCSRKYAAEAFSFITFIVTLASFLVEFAFMYEAKGETHAGETREVGQNDDLGTLSRNLQNYGLMP